MRLTRLLLAFKPSTVCQLHGFVLCVVLMSNQGIDFRVCLDLPVLLTDLCLEFLHQRLVQDFTNFSKIFSNRVGFPCDVIQHGCFLSLRGGEMMSDNLSFLTVSIQSSISLLQSHGVPRDLNVEQITACMLEVQAFCGSIRCHENMCVGIRIVESCLNQGALIIRRTSRQNCNVRLFPTLFSESVKNVLERINVFCENQHSFSVP